jgi:hypothetical protein
MLPKLVRAGDALIVADKVAPGTGRRGYWSNTDGRSACSEMLPVVFVRYPVAPGMLRPPAIGNSSLCAMLRSFPLQESSVDAARFPSVIDIDALEVDWSKWGSGNPNDRPDFANMAAVFDRFCGDVYNGWSTDTRTPDSQHPGYGSHLAGAVSQALVLLCSKSQSKHSLALAITQWGLDLAGAYSDGRMAEANGGHCAGRKALILAAAHALGLPDVLSFLGSPSDYQFQEDIAYCTTFGWWFPCWITAWRHNPNQHIVGRSPTTWTAEDKRLFGYISQVVGAQVGTALAVRLMGRTRQMGWIFDRMVEQWMQGPPAEAQEALQAADVTIPWGTDYSIVRGLGMCAAAWRQYAR